MVRLLETPQIRQEAFWLKCTRSIAFVQKYREFRPQQEIEYQGSFLEKTTFQPATEDCTGREWRLNSSWFVTVPLNRCWTMMQSEWEGVDSLNLANPSILSKDSVSNRSQTCKSQSWRDVDPHSWSIIHWVSTGESKPFSVQYSICDMMSAEFQHVRWWN